MPAPELSELPASLKSIQPYLKIANEHDQRDPVVSYWARLYALQTGMKLSSKGPEERNFLIKLMDWLETTKKEQHDNEAITNEVAAQAHLENWALKLFLFADKNDRAGNFTKNVIQSFYTAGLLYDVLTTFGELTDEAAQNRKYAKWKAAYIHNCLKNGETPVPGPVNSEKDDSEVPPKPDEQLDNSDDDNELEKSESLENPAEKNEAEPEAEPEGFDNAENIQDEKHDAEAESELKDETAGVEEEVDKPPQPAEPSQPTPPPRADPYGFPSPPGATNPPATPATSSIPPYPSLPSDNSLPSTPQPYNPPSTPITTNPSVDYSSRLNAGEITLTAEQMTKVSKYIKWAGSAVNYDDVPTAVQNLQKALHLLTTGQDS
ncbi:vacuolar protein sorting-associated protein VTA1 homolog isoform X2 [Diachasma alloeum]|uniref:vacuolar protein sorting-associated protein VTA1 homolog isoform X2 n=1 Tax=Diachasma alloeum TaxID=454923 RepID=UPI0007384DB1|nr:vacuolar protein sorting-associated protein VTA1 homolog isoform X2 [Diachasma alloeum]